eukprot:7383486-Prymnesium_polylepis.3
MGFDVEGHDLCCVRLGSLTTGCTDRISRRDRSRWQMAGSAEVLKGVSAVEMAAGVVMGVTVAQTVTATPGADAVAKVVKLSRRR